VDTTLSIFKMLLICFIILDLTSNHVTTHSIHHTEIFFITFELIFIIYYIKFSMINLKIFFFLFYIILLNLLYIHFIFIFKLYNAFSKKSNT